MSFKRKIKMSDNSKMKIRMVQRKRAKYSQETLQRALAQLKEGISINKVSREYEIPRSTLQAKMSNRYPTSRPGPDPVLNEEEENNIVRWVDYMCSIGRPITKDHLTDSVALYVKKMAKPNLFVGGRPGRHWLEGFFRRHDGVKLKIRNHNATISKQPMNLDNFCKWFKIVNYSIQQESLENIDSSRVFNIGEIIVSANLSSEASEENVTVLVCGNAAGQFAPTMVIFDSATHGDMVINIPGKFICTSNKALMTSELFYEYIEKYFYPWLLESKIERTVILFVDDHVTYFTQMLNEFCCDYNIALVALPGNTTHFMQPLETELFPSLRDFFKKNLNTSPNKFKPPQGREYFQSVLQESLSTLDINKKLQKSFAECGLYPLANDETQYKKIFFKGQRRRRQKRRYDSIDQELDVQQSLLESIEQFIDPPKLKSFRSSVNNYRWKGNVKDTALFYLWKKILTSSRQGNENQCQNNNIENEPMNISTDDTFDSRVVVVDPNKLFLDSDSETN